MPTPESTMEMVLFVLSGIKWMNNSGCVIFYSFKNKEQEQGQSHNTILIWSQIRRKKKKEKEAFGSTDLCTQERKTKKKKSLDLITIYLRL